MDFAARCLRAITIPPREKARVTVRTRKFIGAVLLMLFVGIYAVLVMAFGSSRLMTLGWFVNLLFYVAAGLLWVPPAAWLIRWMQKP